MSASAMLRLVVPVEESPSTSWADDRLVAACLDGDQRAWDALVDKYKRLVYSIALRYHATPEDAADIFQSVCLDLFTELPRIREARSIAGWLAAVTSHAALRWRRRSARRDRVERPDLDAAQVGETICTPADDIVALERAQEIREAIMRLPERCQAMLRMLFFEDPPRPYAEIAASMGLATGSIGFIRGRCLEKLRRVVAEP